MATLKNTTKNKRNDLKIAGFPRASGSGDMTELEWIRAVQQINQISNPLEKELRMIRLMKQWNFGV